MQEIYIKLEKIFNNNEHLLLCSSCEKLLEKYPTDIEILTYLSRSLLTLSKLEQSKEICERIIKLNKNIPEPYLNIARIYSNQKKFEQAINFYKKTLEIDASYFVYFELGVLYFNINDYSNSGYFISKAVKAKIDLAEGYFYLGLIYQKANKIYLAIESFTEAIKYKSDYASAYNNLGTLYLDLNKADEAIYYFNQAIKFNSKLYIAHSNLAQGYLVKGDFDKVKSVLIKSLDIKPDDGESHRLLSVIYKYKSKEDSHFRQMYEHVSKVNLDKNSKMHFNFALAKASEDMKDYKSSANFLKIGNSIRRTNFNYNINFDIEQFSLIKKNFTKEIFEKHKDKGCLTNKSIFIIGMPRSGTTLIEQIISSHPEEFQHRQKNKLGYRYPGVGGESYLDVIERLNPIIIELERQQKDISVVCHIAVLRCIYAYFMGIELKNIPFIEIDSNIIYELEPGPFGCKCKEIHVNTLVDR